MRGGELRYDPQVASAGTGVLETVGSNAPLFLVACAEPFGARVDANQASTPPGCRSRN